MKRAVSQRQSATVVILALWLVAAVLERREHRLAAEGVDMDDVGLTLEDHSVAGFHTSYQEVLAALVAKARR